MMQDKAVVEAELAKLMEIRNAFYDYLDENLPKDARGHFNFSGMPRLEAERVYEHFFKLDYQARKLRAFLVQDYGLNPE
jgi:hypothetical protein